MFTQDPGDRGSPASSLEDLGDGSSPLPGAAAEDLQAFQRAWFRAVALAWSDAEKLEALKRAPARFLETHCDYRLPGSVALTVREANGRPVDGAPSGWGSPREGWSLPQTEITLYVPPAPALEEREVALAELADPAESMPLCC